MEWGRGRGREASGSPGVAVQGGGGWGPPCPRIPRDLRPCHPTALSGTRSLEYEGKKASRTVGSTGRSSPAAVPPVKPLRPRCRARTGGPAQAAECDHLERKLNNEVLRGGAARRRARTGAASGLPTTDRQVAPKSSSRLCPRALRWPTSCCFCNLKTGMLDGSRSWAGWAPRGEEVHG